jgi:hypothetical protein
MSVRDMPIDRSHIGFRIAPFTVTVRADDIRKFAAAIGFTAVSDKAPPTYMKVIEGANGSSRALLEALRIDLRKVLHTEQEFEYFGAIRGGDEITVERRVADISVQKDGTRELVIVESTLRNRDGGQVGRSRQWILVRNDLPQKMQ